jgi:hypothetical protein
VPKWPVPIPIQCLQNLNLMRLIVLFQLSKRNYRNHKILIAKLLYKWKCPKNIYTLICSQIIMPRIMPKHFFSVNFRLLPDL